jgi:hypothetical protein
MRIAYLESGTAVKKKKCAALCPDDFLKDDVKSVETDAYPGIVTAQTACASRLYLYASIPYYSRVVPAKRKPLSSSSSFGL